MKTTEQYLIDTLNKRVTELVKDKTFQAEVRKCCKTKEEAKEYAHNRRVYGKLEIKMC